MYHGSIAETLGTSLPSIMPGGVSDDLEIPNTTKSSNLDALLSKAQLSTSAQRGSQQVPQSFCLQQPTNILPAAPMAPIQQIASPMQLNAPPAAVTQLLQPIHQVQQPIHQVQQPIHQVQQPIHQIQQPIHQVQQPAAMPQASVPQASFVPVQPSAVSDVALEAQMLQHQLARQTGDMQNFLKSELNKLSAAMRSISLSPPRMGSVAQPTTGLLAQNSQPYAVPPHVLSQELQLQDLTSVTAIQPSAVSMRAQHVSQPVLSQPVAYATPVRVVTSEMVTEAQKRVASPVWDSEFVNNSDDNQTRGLTAPMLARFAENFSEATTSMPTIRGLNDSVADQNIELINPPSESTHVVDPEVVREHYFKLKRSLSHVEEAPSAMQHANNLGALSFETLIDVLHEQYPTLERKEVALTWRSLVTAYQQAGANFAARPAGKPSNPKHYELDESPPPTPKSSAKSNLSEEYTTNNYETTLKEVMSFIDKRMYFMLKNSCEYQSIELQVF